MIQVSMPDELTNAAVHRMLSSIARSVTLNDRPAEITCVQEPGGGMRLSAAFDTCSGERYRLQLELTPV